jgi:hypothetical protein
MLKANSQKVPASRLRKSEVLSQVWMHFGKQPLVICLRNLLIDDRVKARAAILPVIRAMQHWMTCANSSIKWGLNTVRFSPKAHAGLDI